MPPTVLAIALLRGTSMSRPPPPTATPLVLPHVWSDLPSDLQQRAVRLLAQLAYVQLRPHASLATQEVRHGHRSQQSQDSPGPS
jgi:hypothetical protein